MGCVWPGLLEQKMACPSHAACLYLLVQSVVYTEEAAGVGRHGECPGAAGPCQVPCAPVFEGQVTWLHLWFQDEHRGFLCPPRAGLCTFVC